MEDFGVSMVLKELNEAEVKKVVFFISHKLGVSDKSDLLYVNDDDFAEEKLLTEDQVKRLIRYWQPLDFEVSKALCNLNESEVIKVTLFIREKLGVEEATDLVFIKEEDFTSNKILKIAQARRLINYWKESK